MTVGAEPQKRPRTASREVRRRQLIEATIASIAENGLTGTTMASVTGRADLAMGSVSFHFRSKDNLLRETLAYLAEEHRARWAENIADSGLDPAARLAAVMDAHFAPEICNETRIAVWYAFFGEARYREIYREMAAAFDEERTETVAALCRALADEAAPGMVPEEVADTLECLADGLWLAIMLYPGWFGRDAAKRRIHAYLAGVFPCAFATWPGVPAGGGAATAQCSTGRPI